MYRELTEQEQNYLSEGGRVFLVSDDNEVVILKQGEDVFYLCDHVTKESYKFPTEDIALKNAWVTACLSEDDPMVEGVVVGVMATQPTTTLRP